jgi:hypothetical protein
VRVVDAPLASVTVSDPPANAGAAPVLNARGDRSDRSVAFSSDDGGGGGGGGGGGHL